MTILCESDESTAQFLTLVLDGHVETVGSLQTALVRLASQFGSRLLVIGAEADLDEALLVTSLLVIDRPDTSIVLLRDVLTNDLHDRARRVGIEQVISSGDAEEIARACRLAVPLGSGGVTPPRQSKRSIGNIPLTGLNLSRDETPRAFLSDRDLRSLTAPTEHAEASPTVTLPPITSTPSTAPLSGPAGVELDPHPTSCGLIRGSPDGRSNSQEG